MSRPVEVSEDLYPLNQFSVPKSFLRERRGRCLEGILIPNGMITSRVDKLREEVSQHYSKKSCGLLAMPVMKGSLQFFVELLYDSRFQTPFEVEYSESSRYGGLGSSSNKDAEVKVSNPEAIKGRHVLVVEDIVDEGVTAKTLSEELRPHEPSSLSLVVLLDKPSRREPGLNLYDCFDEVWTGFTIPNLFVVGYGLDFKEKYRSLQHLAVLKKV